jgi:ribonucleoside-diphosphate reductase beta chain
MNGECFPILLLMMHLTRGCHYRISRDEGLHFKMALQLYRELVHKLPTPKIHEIIQDAVEAEVAFVRESIPEGILGMNAGLMIQHVQSVADYIAHEFTGSTIYNVKTPFDFMAQLGVSNKTNFSEFKVSEYKFNHGAVVADTSLAIDAEH